MVPLPYKDVVYDRSYDEDEDNDIDPLDLNRSTYEEILLHEDLFYACL
jgi:hypothetical protein